MNSRELMDKLFLMDTTANYSHSCDTFKSGDPEKEIKKVGVCMFATVEVIREAAKWGADILITHEPVFYNHMDTTGHLENNPVYLGKRSIIDESGMAICRIHDHMHHANLDRIALGEMEYLGLEYAHVANPYYAVNRFELKEPIKANDLLERIKDVLGVKHARLCGDGEMEITNITGCFGTPGHILDEINDPWCQVVLAGETAEWYECEYIRDAAALGMKKAMIVMGHCGSERAGMVYMAEGMKKDYPELDIKYFECGECYN